jgi:hypothetical protein
MLVVQQINWSSKDMKASSPAANKATGHMKKAGPIKKIGCFQAGFFLGLFFVPEDGGSIFLRNIG